MTWLFRLLDRTARPAPLAIIFIAVLVFRVGMQGTLARLREVSGESIPDYEIFYSRDRLIRIFSSYGEQGAELYQRFLTFDLAFPLLYSTLFASLLHLALAKTRYRPLALAPFVMALFDYVENAFFFAFLKLQPDFSETAVTVSNGVTLGKFGFGAISAIAGIIAAVVLIGRWTRRSGS